MGAIGQSMSESRAGKKNWPPGAGTSGRFREAFRAVWFSKPAGGSQEESEPGQRLLGSPASADLIGQEY